MTKDIATEQHPTEERPTSAPVEAADDVRGYGTAARVVESVGRLAEGVGVVTGSPLLILVGGWLY